MFKGSIRIFLGLIEFIKSLIARKFYFFKVNLGFNWKKLKFEGRIEIFKINLVKSRA